MTPDSALAVCRFAHDAAAMLLWGAFAYLAALVPPDLGRDIAGRLATFRAVAVAVAAGSSLVALPIESAAVGDGWPDAIDPATIRAVLLETSVGWALTAQGVAAAMLLATGMAPRRWRLHATACAAGLCLATLALTGHAAMQEGWLRLAHRGNDIAHVLAAGAWLGALVPLLPILRAMRRSESHAGAVVALRRFSIAGHGAVAVVLGTGAVNTGLTLGGWPTQWSSPYQALLALKIALVSIMAGLALANRYVVVPRMARQDGSAVRVLRAATGAEIVLGLAAVACVSVFGLLEPS